MTQNGFYPNKTKIAKAFIFSKIIPPVNEVHFTYILKEVLPSSVLQQMESWSSTCEVHPSSVLQQIKSWSSTYEVHFMPMLGFGTLLVPWFHFWYPFLILFFRYETPYVLLFWEKNGDFTAQMYYFGKWSFLLFFVLWEKPYK